MKLFSAAQALQRRATLLATAGLLLGTNATLLAPPAWAQTTSTDKSVRFILPNAVASGVDTITRTAQAALAKALGHPVVVENQPGAGGIVGVQALVRAPADGFTLSVVSNNVVILPSVYKTVPFDLATDITPIAIVGATPIVLVVNPKLAANNSKELVALLLAKPGQLNYASSGNGTILHLAAEMYVDEAGAKAGHVPYKGVGPMLNDLIGGQVDFATAALPSVQQHLKSGALRAIGVGAPQRVAAAPEIPTMAEQGMPGYLVDAWFAVVGPKGMAPAEVKRINTALATAFADPAVKEAMVKQGNVINISTPEVAQQYFKTELVKYAKLVKKAGIELQ
jgi:tripartite-type tricarboxylate transporter receptor subunit TctC